MFDPAPKRVNFDLYDIISVFLHNLKISQSLVLFLISLPDDKYKKKKLKSKGVQNLLLTLRMI
ncbi:hypothetical protein LPYR103PRE_11880 [Segatella asaccharophila]